MGRILWRNPPRPKDLLETRRRAQARNRAPGYSVVMRFLALLVLMTAPAQAGVDLRWAPALHDALADLKGPGREIAQGFDSGILRGLDVRLNEIDVLSQAGVRDLAALGRLNHSPNAAATGVPPAHLAALERSLQLLSPVIERLEARGFRLDDAARPAVNLPDHFSQELVAEARETETRARALTARYVDEKRTLDQALADSQEVDALLHDRYFFLSIGALDKLARVYDSGRTGLLAAQLAPAKAQELAMVAADEREGLRDAVAQPLPKSIFRRLTGALASLLK